MSTPTQPEDSADIAAIRHTLMTGLAHNAAIAALDRLAAPQQAGGEASMRAALEAVDKEWTDFWPLGPDVPKTSDRVASIAPRTVEIWKMVRAALASPVAPAQEPVAYLLTRPSGFQWSAMASALPHEVRIVHEADGVRIEPLTIAAAPVRKPLTDRQIAEATPGLGHVRSDYLIAIARAIERAHGIASPEEKQS